MRRWVGRSLAAAALMAGLAACGTSNAAFGGGGSTRTQTTGAGPAQSRTTGTTQTRTQTSAGPVTRTATGAQTHTGLPAGRPSNHASLSGQLRLAHTTVAEGGLLQAELILYSSARHARVLDRACQGQFIALVLSGPGGSTSIFWTGQVCRPGVPFVAQPGTTIYPLQARATFGQCILIGHKPSADVPQCLAGNRLPPLPPGTYRASIIAHDAPLAADLAGVRSVQVKVTP